MRLGTRGRVFAALSLAATFVIASTATAATPLGFVSPGEPTACAGNLNTVQVPIGTGGAYEVPSDGVLTSWRHRGRTGAPGPGGGRLQVWRLAGGSDYTLVGRSDPAAFTPGVVNELAAQIPVQAGDMIGLRVGPAGNGCAIPGGSGTIQNDNAGSPDPEPGQTVSLATTSTPILLNVAATLEPDCDLDGFGDETQDAVVDCVVPETQLTKVPKDKVKTKKKRAKVTFEFTGTDARAIAAFECSLDGAAYSPCTSPHTVEVKKGTHTFSVRVTDQAGNVDGSPATDDWKVKRKRKKKK